MGVFDKFKAGLQRTREKLSREIKRIVTDSPKLDDEVLEEIEITLIGADLGVSMTGKILASIRDKYEAQGDSGLDVLAVAKREVSESFEEGIKGLKHESGTTVVSVVGVNGTGKTTTSAKLASWIQTSGKVPMLAACDTFRAAAVEQLMEWGGRLNVPVIAGNYGADPASVAHDAVSAAQARKVDYLFIDTAGRLHTKNNLMQELEKMHRVIGRQEDGAPHEVLLVVDGTTGANALSQAREFHKAVSLTGLVITKLDGTSKGGGVVAIHEELGLPVKFVGLGERADDLHPFDPGQFTEALFDD